MLQQPDFSSLVSNNNQLHDRLLAQHHPFNSQSWFYFFYEHLTFSNQISALSKSCYSQFSYSWTSLRPTQRNLDFETASRPTIVHAKLDYCNSLYFNLPHSEMNRFKLIQNSVARQSRQVFSHALTPRLHCKLLSHIQSSRSLPFNVLRLIWVYLTSAHRNTRSSSAFTIFAMSPSVTLMFEMDQILC